MKLQISLLLILIIYIISIFFSKQAFASTTGDSDNIKDKKYEVKGTIVDSKTNTPVQYANIALYNALDSSLITGNISDSNGVFEITGLSKGNYYLTANFIGYKKEIVSNIKMEKSKSKYDIGLIHIEPSHEMLKEVEVVAQKSYVTYKADKKVINVSQHYSSAGGTAKDVLKNMPTVSEDIDGNITMRGSTNYIVLIDGKPTSMSGNDILQQLPADMIENIELITNPSAKYDPEGDAGIINIIMKKNASKNKSLNGIFNASASTIGSINTSVTINKQVNDELKLYGNINYSNRINNGEGIGNKTFFGDTILILDDIVSQNRSRKEYATKAGLDYIINKKQNIDWSTQFNKIIFNRSHDINYHEYYNPVFMNNYFSSFNDFEIDGFYLMTFLTHQYKFNEKGHMLQTMFSGSRWEGEQHENQVQYVSEDDWEYNESAIFNKIKAIDTDYSNDYQLNVDYTLPLNNVAKLEMGYQLKTKEQCSNYEHNNLNISTGNWIENPNLSSDMAILRKVHALYTTFEDTLFKFNYKIGLRYEYLDRNIVQNKLGKQYPIYKHDIYPCMHITKELSKKQRMQIGYSRRVNRPIHWQLNPTPHFSDNYNLGYGNPALLPEYIDSYELSYFNQIKLGYISSELYFRQTNNAIERINYLSEDNIIIHKPINADKHQHSGIELSTSLKFTKWFMLNMSANGYYYTLNGQYEDTPVAKQSYGSNFRSAAVFNVLKYTSVQLSGFYNSKKETIQGTVLPMYGINAGIKQFVWNRKATINIQFNDVFNTMRYKVNLNNNDYTSTVDYNMLSQHITFSFVYNLNNYRPKRQQNIENNSMDMGI